MEAQKLELLESRILKAIDEITRLREENTRLEAKVEDLKKEAADKDSTISTLNQDAQKAQDLSLKNRELLQERDEIRLKIESLLDKLERIDII